MTNIVEEIQLGFDDVLIRPNKSFVNSRSEIDLNREYKFFQTNSVIQGIFIMNANMYTTGNKDTVYEMLKHNMFACLHKHHTIEELQNIFENMSDDYKNRCFYSIGLKDEETKKFDYLYKNYKLKNVVIDVPNAYIPKFLEKIREIRKEYPDSRIIAGNVCTSEGCMEIILAGADCVKINIGNGAMCLTRRQTGIGRPTLSTIIECANTCHQLGALCLSDGGIRYTSDIVKALGANADGIMIGSMFAGTDEAAGELVEKMYRTNEYEFYEEECCTLTKPSTREWTEYHPDKPIYKIKKFKQHFGMSSTLANNKFAGGMKDYKASEGREALIPYTGPLENILNEIQGGLRSAMTYIGCTKLKHISKHTTFFRVNEGSQINKSMEQYDSISN